MAWATKEYASDITGTTVTDANIGVAQGMIELFSGVTEEYNLRKRDVRHLKMAVAYQAAWVAGQIDVTTRTDVGQVSQDEMSFTYANPDAVVLAPLARAALKRLSWKTSRSVRLQRPRDPGEGLTVQAQERAFVTDDETMFSESQYRPMGGS